MVDALIKEIQDKNIPLSMILLKAKIVATKRKDQNFLKWLELELGGYEKGKNKPPEYRKMRGQAKFWNPMLGWCPILFSSSEVEKQMVNRSTNQSIAEIEQLLEADSQEFEMPYPASVAEEIMRGEMKTKVSMFIGRSSLVGILSKVRNMILDWALGLEEKVGPEISENSQHSEVLKLKNKAQLIKDFNSFDFKNLKVSEKIYLLKVFYSYYEAIIKTYYGPGLFYLTSGIDDLNDYFKILRKKMIEIIESDKTFSEMKNAKAYQGLIDPMTSLYSSADFFDGVWEDFTLPNLIDFREEIADKDLFENNSEIHKVDAKVNNFFEAISKEIDELKKFLDQKERNFHEQDLPKYKKQFDDTFKPDKGQTIKHEHTHHFENSIQEKDIGVNIKNVDENVVVKNSGKRITLPKFPRTEWSKVSIIFMDERNIILSDGKNNKPSSFEGLGCDDGRTGKPDDNWDFFLKLAQGNGQTLPIGKKEREKKKKQKQKITDILRKIFDTETDPFEKEAGGVYKAKFSIKYTAEETSPKRKGKYADSEEVFAEMTEPSQEDIESEFSQ